MRWWPGLGLARVGVLRSTLLSLALAVSACSDPQLLSGGVGSGGSGLAEGFVTGFGSIIVDGVAILWLNAKTRTEGSKGAIQGPGWQLVIREDTTRDYELFLATKTLWEAQNKDIRPRQLTYQLTHKK